MGHKRGGMQDDAMETEAWKRDGGGQDTRKSGETDRLMSQTWAWGRDDGATGVDYVCGGSTSRARQQKDRKTKHDAHSPRGWEENQRGCKSKMQLQRHGRRTTQHNKKKNA